MRDVVLELVLSFIEIVFGVCGTSLQLCGFEVEVECYAFLRKILV